MSVRGTFETCQPAGECPVIGVERKSSVHSQADAIDPTRTLGALVLAELFLPRPGQYEVFWMGVGSCRLV